jgi:uncharacterized protein (TIRG00374 family)
VTNRVRLALGVFVSIVCTVLVLRGLDWREAARTIASVDPGVVLLAVVILAAGLAFKALRWRVLFRPRRDVSFWRLLDAINIGFLANNVLPARVGELVRPFVMSETGGPPYAWGLSTVVVERTIDVVTVVVVTLAVIAFLPVPGWLAFGAVALGAASVVGLAALVVAAGSERTVTNLARRLLRRTPLPVDIWTERIAGVVRGFAPLRAPGTMLVAVLWTLPTWGAPFVTFHVILRGVGLDLPFVAAAFSVAVIGLGVAAPSSPGQVGLFEAAGLVGLSAFTGDYERSVAAVLLFHALNYGVTSVAGLISLARTGLTYSRIMSVVSTETPAPRSGDGPAV